jgi:hypothetical protein
MQIVSDPFHPRGAMRMYAMLILGGATILNFAAEAAYEGPPDAATDQSGLARFPCKYQVACILAFILAQALWHTLASSNPNAWSLAHYSCRILIIAQTIFRIPDGLPSGLSLARTPRKHNSNPSPNPSTRWLVPYTPVAPLTLTPSTFRPTTLSSRCHCERHPHTRTPGFTPLCPPTAGAHHHDGPRLECLRLFSRTR